MSKQLGFLSPTTVRKHVSVLNKIFEEAQKDKNPVRYVKLPSKAKFTPYPLAEMEHIHDAIRGTRDEIIVLLAAWCGLRRGEIFALKPNDVDWNNKTIRVDENTAINDENMYVDKGPKSDNGYRNKELAPIRFHDLRHYHRPGSTRRRFPTQCRQASRTRHTDA
ncbi:site-specific integrase [Desulfosporosinus fructosivorans]